MMPGARRHRMSGGAPAAAGRYERLFQVTITHNFYTLERGRCPDLRARPTDATAQLLGTLGLAFKDAGDGFTVFFRPSQIDTMLRYIMREATTPTTGEPGFWTRLTFLLELDDPRFVGVTALPIDLRLSEENLYGTNREAQAGDAGPPATARLCPGHYVSGTALRPITTGEVSFTVPGATEKVQVYDISGAVVIEWPDPDQKAAADAAADAADESDEPPPQLVSLDFGGLPHDLYTIAVIGPGGAPLAGEPVREVLYVPSGSESVMLLDMLLTQPTPDSAGVYPIPSLHLAGAQGEQWGRLLYRLPFDARHTYWQYYVVSQVPGSRLDDLVIAGQGADFAADPVPVLLPDGKWATLFSATKPLPLREKSAQHFHLTGLRQSASGQENPVVVSRLPVAPAAPVWPGPAGESSTGTSEMFVYV